MQIKIATGKLIDVGKAETEVVKLNIWDIAQGLENVRRFNGQHPNNPNVCQHSVGVYNLAVFYEQSARIQAGCLFHDCAEMIIGDISSPVKNELRGLAKQVSTLDLLECEWQDAMFEFFFNLFLTKAEWKIIKKYDEMSFAYEVGQWANNEYPMPPYGGPTNWSLRFRDAYDRITRALNESKK